MRSLGVLGMARYFSHGRTFVIQKIFRAYPEGFLHSHIYTDMLMDLSCN